MKSDLICSVHGATVLVVLACGIASLTISAQGKDRYVGTTGTDTGNCTSQAHPCHTFNYVDSHSASGDVVHVLPGTYTLTAGTCIVTNTGGVTWQSDDHGAATIDGGGHCQYIWHNSGSSGYIKIIGFQFTGVQLNAALNSIGVLLEGSQGNFEVAYNTFHDFGGSNPNYNFGAALEAAPWAIGNYTGRTCAIHDNTFRNIAPGGSFLHNGYSVYAICGRNGGDADPRIYNNLFYNEGSIAIHLWHAADHIHVYNNTIDHANMGILVGTGDQGAIDRAFFDLTNNIVSNSHYGICAEDGGGYTLSPSSSFNNNLNFNNSVDWRYKQSDKILNILTSFRAAGNVTTDPQYSNPATGDYVPLRSSPAAGSGLRTGYTPLVDPNGIARTNRPSLGAYEPGSAYADRTRKQNVIQQTSLRANRKPSEE